MHQEGQSKSKPENDMGGSDGKEEITEMTHGHQGGQFKLKPENGLGGSDEKEDEMIEDSHLVELGKSIRKGDRNAVKQFFVLDKHPLDTIIISNRGYTALHFAIAVGEYEIAEDLIRMMSETGLEKKITSTIGGETALHFVATRGIIHLARCIVKKNRNVLTIEDDEGRIPVTAACAVGHKEMTRYLYSVTQSEVFLPRNGNYGIDLMSGCMQNKILDICLDLIQRNTKLTVATRKEKRGFSPIFIMSCQPNAFLSGCRLRFWQKWIYRRLLMVEVPTTAPHELRIFVTTESSKKKTSEYKVFECVQIDYIIT